MKKNYMLKECLENLNKEKLESVINCNVYLSDNDIDKKDISIKKLSELILMNFKRGLIIQNFSESDQRLLSQGESKECSPFLYMCGYAFKNEENAQLSFICPQEIRDIYATSFNGETAVQRFDYLFNIYLYTNGVVGEELIKNIIDMNGLNITLEEAKNYINDQGIKEYHNYYYSNCELTPKQMDKLIAQKEQISYKYLSNDEIEEYTTDLLIFLEKMYELKVEPSIIENLMVYINLNSIFDTDEITDYILKKCKLNTKKQKELNEVVNDLIEINRYWALNGRTSAEYDHESIIEDMLLKNKPKSYKLLDLINNLKPSGIENLRGSYILADASSEELNDAIIASFTSEIKLWDPEYIESFKVVHNHEYQYDLDIDDFLSGYIFAYQKNDKIIAIIPNEIMEIIENTDIDSLPTRNDFDKDIFNEDFFDKLASQFVDVIVYNYLNMNGVLTAKRLQELLRNNHDIDITKKKLDKIVKENDYDIVDKEYYSVIQGMPKNEILTLIALKDKKEYKRFDYGEDYEDDLIEDLEEYLNDYGNGVKEEVISTIITAIKMGVFSKEILNDFNYFSSKKQKELLELIKKYKNDISVWTYNGYTQNEMIVNKPKKIGRNEPCPCGSGKKYKKCCGK